MKIYFIITGVLLVIIGSFVLFAYVPAARTRFANLFPSNILPATSRQQVKINGHTISIQVATTDAQKRQGLSDRDSLPQDAGMLFRSEEHTSELQSRRDLVCRLLLEK